MSFLPVYSLSEFEKAVIVRLEDDELRYKYQRMAGLVARNVRERFPPVPDKKSNAEEKVVHFPEWLNPISSFLGSYDKERFNSERTNFNANTIHTMANKSTLVNSVGYALLLHYRLHMSTKTADLEDAARLDRVVFGGKTFEEAVGDPVFVHEPDHYEEPPPMSAPMAHPQYLTAKEGRELLEKNPAHSGWLSPHNHYTIPLEGRKAEFKRLTKFAEGDEAPFRVLPIIAPSGAGKTRLVSEWMRRYSAVTNPETEWEAGFLTSENQDNARDPEPWKEWEIVKHTLIVIDYTYAFDEVVQAIAARAIKRPAGPRFKVRLIVIDHVMPTLLRDDFFWGKVAGGKRASLDLFEARYLEKELVLKSEQDDSSMLRKIIAAAGSVGQEFSLKEGDPLVTEAMEQLDRMGHEQGERDTVRHPLFAALLGRALRNTAGTVDFSKWTRRDLVEQYFTGEDRLPWGDGHSNTGGSDRTERGLYVGALVSAATLMRGLDQLVAKDIIPSSTREAFQIAQRVVSSASPHRIEPFLPDILGETFVLKFLEATEDSPEVFAKFIALLSMEDENPIEQARNFRETIARLARNLSGDNPNLDEVKENWRRLVEFLNPSRFRSDSTLQVFISYAAVDTMEMLHSVDNEQTENSNPTELNRYYALLRSKLEMQIMINHVYAENSAEDLMGWAKTAFCLYEKSSPSGREAQQQALANVARVFAARNAHEWTGTILASFFGRLIAVDFFLKELRENVNTAGVAGDTALMTASLNGHDAIVARLIEAGADVNQARTNDGTTALMMASQNGHEAIAARLIKAGALVSQPGKDDYATGCKSCFRFWKRQLRLVSAGCWRRTKR